MLRILLALSFAFAGLAFVAPAADASACTTDLNPTDDDGVGATCTVQQVGETCGVSAGAYGDPRPSVSCDPPIIVCVREPCP
jgi:hypothetical protein